MPELLLIAMHTPTGLDGLYGADGSLGDADAEPAKDPEDEGGLRMAHPTPIFVQGDVEGVVEARFDHPVSPLEFKPSQGVELLQTQACDQIDDFGGALPFASHPGAQPRNQSRSGKAHLFRSNFLAIQKPDLASAPVTFPSERSGLRRGFRGKIPWA